MLTYLTTDLFDSPAQTLVNPVNTVGVMGKGLAFAFNQRYPDMFYEYRQRCQAGDLEVGRLHVYRAPDKTIVNFPTKKHWRHSSQMTYIESGLQKFVTIYPVHEISSVSFPQLGCGYGGLNWEQQVQPVMERCLEDLSIPVYIHLFQRC